MIKNFFKTVWQKKDASVWIVFIRLVIGIEWFMAGLGKLIDSGYASGMSSTLGFFATPFDSVTGFGNPNTWFVNLTNNVFIPNSEIFAWLVALGELFVGLTLLLGLFVNLSAFMSVFLNLTFYFAAAWTGPSTRSINWIMMILGLIVLLSPGSKLLSIDHLIADKFPTLQRFLLDWFGFEKKATK